MKIGYQLALGLVSISLFSAGAAFGQVNGAPVTVGGTGTAAPKANRPQRVPLNAAALVPTLAQAYTVLASADHDYGGHREAAMKNISEASSLLGTPIAGQGAGRQLQPLSNIELQSVQMQLLAVGRSIPENSNKPGVLKHVNNAINEITEALAVGPAGIKPGQVGGPAVIGAVPAHSNGLGGGSVVAQDPVGSNSVEGAALVNIYETLSIGDHDYKGHRVRAMAAIRRAVTALGGQVSGDGHSHENQAASDQDIHNAQTLLVQVQQSFGFEDSHKVLNDLNTAVTEMNTALSVK